MTALVGCTKNEESALKEVPKTEAKTETKAKSQVTTINCEQSPDFLYDIKQTFDLGKTPRTISLIDERKSAITRLNADARDENVFVRAASGIVLSGSSKKAFKVVIAQDSRRHLAEVSIPRTLLRKGGKGKVSASAIKMIPVDTAEAISTFDDPKRDYKSYRKKNKADYEAMTLLPDGRTLILGSGSDIDSVNADSSKRADAILVDQTGKVSRYQVLPFYISMLANSDIVGPPSTGGTAILNIEGVAISSPNGEPMITFAHRGNGNGNGHNSLTSYNLKDWLLMLETPNKPIEPKNITVLKFPIVTIKESESSDVVPVTLNDLMFADQEGGLAFVPAGAEAEYVDKTGMHHDGDVVAQGIAKVDFKGGTCKFLRARGDHELGTKSRFGKFEGLVKVEDQGSTLLLGIIDADSEIVPSTISILSGL
jgi:hypothetical protein